MADCTSIAGPSQPKKRKVNKKMTDAEILELLEKSDLSDYDSVDDEDYCWDSTSESERDSDVYTDILFITSRKIKAPSNKALINCQYRTAPFSGSNRNKVSYGDRRSQEMTIILRQAFEGAILTNLYPGSQIDIYFLVLYADGGLCSTCINAGTLAVINAGIPMTDYLCACSAGFVNETPLMDINHIEGFLGGTELNLAILKKSEAIVCDELSARIHKDHMNKLRKIAIQGCKDIYAILDAAIRKHSAEIQAS